VPTSSHASRLSSATNSSRAISRPPVPSKISTPNWALDSQDQAVPEQRVWQEGRHRIFSAEIWTVMVATTWRHSDSVLHEGGAVNHRCLATLIIATLWLTLGCDEPADEETDLISDSAGPDVSESWLSDACIEALIEYDQGLFRDATCEDDSDCDELYGGDYPSADACSTMRIVAGYEPCFLRGGGRFNHGSTELLRLYDLAREVCPDEAFQLGGAVNDGCCHCNTCGRHGLCTVRQCY